MAKKQSVEQRIHAAIRRGSGLHLSAEDVLALAWLDNAILTRIANQAAVEGGQDEYGDADQRIFRQTWTQLKKGRYG